MAKAAYLRVYMPADEVGYFPEHVRSAHPTRVLTRNTFGVWHEAPRDDAFITEHRGRRYVCPRFPRLRMLEGLLAFRNTYPGLTASLLVPEKMAESATRELERIHSNWPAVRSHILTSPWHVPLRWFAAFDPEDRELVQSSRRGLSIRYRTLLGDALRRMRRAVRVLEESGFEDPVVEQLQDVVAWLDGFPADALVELDYGGVASLFAEGDLVIDETAKEVAASLDALEEGDIERAGEWYAAAASRWAHAQSIAFAN